MRRPFLLASLALTLLAACASPPSTEPARLVFFGEDSAALDDGAKAVVAEAAALAARYPQAPVRVLGFADPEGGPALNRALSAARAENVATQLRADGVAPGRIIVGPRGPVPFELAPQESRRVEIRVGG